MGIQNFPATLQPIIQQNFLEREFTEGLHAQLGYRAVADRERFPGQIGETLTKTRRGLKTPVTTPLNPSSNTNLDNGLTSSGWLVEQYTLAINMYGDTIDLNMVTNQVGIEDQFMANARANGAQAASSLDLLARNALFGMSTLVSAGGYMGGNTWVTTTLGSQGVTITVDDIRGLQYVFSNGVLVPVSSGNPMTVTIGAGVYTVTGCTADVTNKSTAASTGGWSGTITTSTNVSVGNGTLYQPVTAATASTIVRPNARATTNALVAGDTLLMQNVLAAVATLRSNNVPPVTSTGMYHCYLDDKQLLGLFADPDFKLLYRGAYGSETYKSGQIIDLLGVRFLPNNMAPQQLTGTTTNTMTTSGLQIHRALVVGQGAIVEGNYAETGYSNVGDSVGLKVFVDDVCMVTREPLDRLQQIIAQSWYWIGGFVLPTDATATTNIIPTATNSYYKRGVIIESL